MLEGADPVVVQQMAGYGRGRWSDDAQLFSGTRAGDSVTLPVPVERAGRYHVDVYLTLAPDFGRAQVLFDGELLGDPIDAYAPIVVPSGRISLGGLNLAQGLHQLRFEVIGANEASSGHRLGIDCLDLVPVRTSE